MSIFVKYLLKTYLKYFFIILISLEVFFVGIDLLQYFSKLPDSANLQILYILYDTFFTLTITIPLSIVFAWIITITLLIKHNSIVSFYSLGISKKRLLRPIINISLLIVFILIGLQTTPLAYSKEQKDKILKNKYFVNEKKNIFLKYNDYFIYFEKLYPLEKKAKNIHIYKVKDNNVVETIIGKTAFYQNKRWYIIDVKIIKKPDKINWDESKLDITYEKFLYTLEGFEPKIINNVYKAKTNFSIRDAIYTIVLLESQNFNTNKIKAILYSKVFVPFFVIALIILIFVFSGDNNRFFNQNKFISLSIFATLLLWGFFFLLQKLAVGGILYAEVALILPLIILFIITYVKYGDEVN